jgi:transposase
MLTLPPAVRLFVCTQPTDMRRGFDRLALMVEQVLKQDSFSGHLFVFRSKRADRVKVLYWDGDGYAIWYKRLEKGTFRFPQGLGDGAELPPSALAMILEGVDPTKVKRSPRYARVCRRGSG